MYYYVKNLQGDIVKIVKQDGSVAASYTYDAWGKLLSVKDGSNVNVPASTTFHVANLNPYRYRGYIYDTETGLYYLQSRYYDPITGRFLNADDMQYIVCCALHNTNLFEYCGNNSICNVDKNGTSFDLGIDVNAMLSSPYDFISNSTPIFQSNLSNLKYIIAKAASIYLDSKGYYVSKKMFLQGLYGEGHEMGPEVKSRMIVLLQQDKDFMKTLKKTATSSNVYFEVYNDKGEAGYEFVKGDLYYSIQHCPVYVAKLYANGKRYLRVVLYDTYDFDNFRWIFKDGEFSIGNSANDLGLLLQYSGLLIPYKWSVSFTYYF